jgi:hypothetical protein
LSAAGKRLMLRAGALAAVIALGGCTYDYIQHTDKVGYSAGDAVKANLEQQTLNPAGKARYNTGGLGSTGNVVTPPTP